MGEMSVRHERATSIRVSMGALVSEGRCQNVLQKRSFLEPCQIRRVIGTMDALVFRGCHSKGRLHGTIPLFRGQRLQKSIGGQRAQGAPDLPTQEVAAI